MNHFSVNGVHQNIPMSLEDSFQDLLRYVRHCYVGESSVISSVRVNGVEINGLEEEALAHVPINQLGSIEVVTAHPKEVAHDALQSLKDFTGVLSNLSFSAADHVEDAAFSQDFARLIDGISTMTETITSSKEIMRVGLLPRVNVLEADLLSILKDILTAQQKGQKEYLIQLLREHLPTHLELWRSEGLPALIRSRDS